MANITLPEPFASIPRESFLFGPSPIQHLPRMSKALGGNVNIYAKREDCNSGLAYGGNKIRKLEYLASEALALGCDSLVSIGGVQSNHTRAVSAVAAKLGLKAATVQEHWVDWDDPGYEKVGNIQLSRLMGADVHLDPSTFGIEHKFSLARLAVDIEARGGRPYAIPAGASDHPLGGDGLRAVGVRGRGAGARDGHLLRHGHRLAQKQGSRARRVIGIDASGRPRETFSQVLHIARLTASRIGLDEPDVTERDVVLNADYNAGVYGVPDEATVDAIKFGARTEAFITDPVYEGKSLAGMMGLIRSGEISEGNVLYAHLGGQLALNAYSEIGL
ncbi:putative 1-aminocyclopropane-1-carboxylate deaminase [Metarhizium anisopliae]|nr:putative 1-aminocyclopropane-1-carboxylate deaminase [Metarhizium anisopliae]